MSHISKGFLEFSIILKSRKGYGTSLMVQWVRLCTPNAGGPGLIPGRGTRSHMHATTKIPCATTKTQHSLNK